MTLFTKIAQRPLADIFLASEAFVLLGVFRAALALVPVRRILLTMTRGRGHDISTPGETPGEGQPGVLAEPALAVARHVRWAVEAATRNSPVSFVCFPQTLAAYVMLRRRGVPSTMVYGIARSADGELLAHTWLLAGDRTVVGGEGSAQFTPIERWS